MPMSHPRPRTKPATLPPYLRIVEALPAAEASDGAAESAPNSKSILIVEDEAGIRALLTDFLFMEGYRATAVPNGVEGVSRFREQRYDLVFTDLRMPGMSGSEVARAVKAHRWQTPVVVITGWDTEPFAAELTDAGVDRVLQKPFDMNEILSLVSELTRGA